MTRRLDRNGIGIVKERRTAFPLENLKEWHEFLAEGFSARPFSLAQACSDGAGEWQIGLDLGAIGGKFLPEDLKRRNTRSR